jgi:hypothetical protein
MNTTACFHQKKIYFPKIYRVIGWISLFLWSSLAILCAVFPNGQNILLPESIFIFLTLLGVYLLLIKKVVLIWDDEYLTATDLWGFKHITFSWNEISHVCFVPMFCGFVVYSRQKSEKIFISLQLDYGDEILLFSEDFIQKCRHLPLERANWEELEFGLKEWKEELKNRKLYDDCIESENKDES